MLRRSAFVILALAALVSIARAADIAPQRTLLGGWPPTPVVITNFLVGIGGFTDARASIAWQDNIAGVWTQFATSTVRQTNKGTLSELTGLNRLLHNRDFTNASWVKTNVTAALNQTGIDSAANAASSLTATAINGTALQSVTLASSVRVVSVFVKRLSGVGEIDMTGDGGTTWTPLTSANCWQSGNDIPSIISSSFFVRCTIPTQTVTNPSSGLRIVTSGDSIVVDFAQNEQTNLSSPILTTTGAVTRAADAITLPTSLINNTYSLAVSFRLPADMVHQGNTLSGGLAAISQATAVSRTQLSYNPTTGTPSQTTVISNAVVAGYSFPPNSLLDNGVHKIGGSNFGVAFDQAIIRAGAPTPPAITNLTVGAIAAPGGTNCQCYIREVALWNAAMSPAQIKGALQLLP